MRFKSFMLLFLFFSLFIQEAYSMISIIYDKDSRTDLLEYPDQNIQRISLSTVAIFEKKFFKEKQSPDHTLSKTLYEYKYKNSSLGKSLSLCPEERFFTQPSASTCSGTLITKDTILTAAHCLEVGCENLLFVFDYYDKGDATLNFSPSQIYECSSLLDISLNPKDSIDYAVIKLDRPVTDRDPVTVNTTGEISLHTPVFVPGYPLGLPLKIADEAEVLNNFSPNGFQINADVFGGNSGSGIFNFETLELEGVLYSGSHDFTVDSKRQCRKINKVKTDDFLLFEYVTRLSAIPYLKTLSLPLN